MHPDIHLQRAYELQRNRIKEAERDRMLRQAQGRAGQPSLIPLLLQRLGGLIFKIGRKLQRGDVPQPTKTLEWAEK